MTAPTGFFAALRPGPLNLFDQLRGALRSPAATRGDPSAVIAFYLAQLPPHPHALGRFVSLMSDPAIGMVVIGYPGVEVILMRASELADLLFNYHVLQPPRPQAQTLRQAVDLLRPRVLRRRQSVLLAHRPPPAADAGAGMEIEMEERFVGGPKFPWKTASAGLCIMLGLALAAFWLRERAEPVSIVLMVLALALPTGMLVATAVTQAVHDSTIGASRMRRIGLPAVPQQLGSDWIALTIPHS